jgi:hypothetical protein
MAVSGRLSRPLLPFGSFYFWFLLCKFPWARTSATLPARPPAEGSRGEGGNAVWAEEGGHAEKVALEQVVGDTTCITSDSTRRSCGKDEVAPIGGDDGVAVAGL